MKVYLYADLYFILNFMMNLFLIAMTAMIRQRKCHFIRWLLLSAVFSLFSVGSTYFLWKLKFWQIICAFVQMVLFVLFSFEKRNKKICRGDFFTFLGLAFLTGGAMEVLQNMLFSCLHNPKVHSLGIIMLSGALFFIVFLAMRWEIIRQKQCCETVKHATVLHNRKEYDIKVLYDTGNQLVSPYTGEGVIIVSEKLERKLELKKTQRPVYIPYHSIGGSGVLEGYRIESLKLGKHNVKKNVLVAVSKELSNNDEIQMILNIT